LAVTICGLGRSARSKCGMKLRQPLAVAKVVASSEVIEAVRSLSELIREELNVKELDLGSDREDLLEYVVELIPEVSGARHGKLLPKLRDTISRMDPKIFVSAYEGNTKVEVVVDGRPVTVSPDEIRISTKPREGWLVVEEGETLVGVEKTIPEDLKVEGLARDLVRRVQDQRKKAGFNIDDRIVIYYDAGPNNLRAFSTFGRYIEAETLADALKRETPPAGSHIAEYKLAGEKLTVGLVKVTRPARSSGSVTSRGV